MMPTTGVQTENFMFSRHGVSTFKLTGNSIVGILNKKIFAVVFGCSIISSKHGFLV